jgi:hypothetical protein
VHRAAPSPRRRSAPSRGEAAPVREDEVLAKVAHKVLGDLARALARQAGQRGARLAEALRRGIDFANVVHALLKWRRDADARCTQEVWAGAEMQPRI